MTEIVKKTNLNIYIENVLCDPTEEVSCPRSMTISYGTEVITFVNHNLIGAAKLEVNENFLIHSDIYKSNFCALFSQQIPSPHRHSKMALH